jgi:hypothetical protein
VSAEVRSLWEVLAQETIGVFVRAALPGAVRVAKVHLEAGVDAELGVLRQLDALVPGQGSSQLLG